MVLISSQSQQAKSRARVTVEELLKTCQKHHIVRFDKKGQERERGKRGISKAEAKKLKSKAARDRVTSEGYKIIMKSISMTAALC